MTDMAGDDTGNDAVASPCISICRMDEVSGLCEGCLRNLDEIAFWSVLDNDDKRTVLAQIEQRRLSVFSQPTPRHPAS